MTPQEQQQTRDAWDKLAAGFDEFTTPFTIPLGEDALHRVGLRPGMRFLDVAAGSGALSLPAARLGARVLATDIAPIMLELLNTRAREEGLSNVEARVMDGQALELEDDTFDVSGSLNGVSLFPDLKRGLRELVRVTKPGGHALIVGFGPPQKAEFFTFFIGAMQATVPGFTGPPMDPPPLPFQVADPEKLRKELADAGLTDVRVETTTWQMQFQSARHFWDMVTNSNPIGAMLVADLTEEQRAEVQKVLDGMLRERSGGGPDAVLNTEVNIGIGMK
jgi:ubiquinone/menaquinone biosynthesis C-methylase UbiE